MREKLQAENLRFFEGASRLAQQIVLDRPAYWEFKLTAEILRSELGPVHQRWQQLKQGMYVRKSLVIPDDQVASWFSAKCNDASNIIQSVKPLIDELNEAFGPPGQPGNDRAILTICRLIVTAAANLLEWEEDVRFIHVSEQFRDMLTAMQGPAGRQLDQLARLPGEISKSLAMENPKGAHEVRLVFSVPEGFVENFKAACQRAIEKSQRRR